MAPLRTGGRQEAVAGLPGADHASGGRRRLADAAGGAARNERGFARPARRRAAVRGPGRARGRRGDRHSEELENNQRPRAQGRTEAGRRGGLRHRVRLDRRRARDRHHGQHRHRRALRRVPFSEAAADAAGRQRAQDRAGAAHPAPPAEPLGQSEPHGGARIRRILAVGLAQAAGLSRSAVRGLRARQRFHRNQRRDPDQRQRQCAGAERSIPGKIRGAGGGVPALRHPALSRRALELADRDRRPENRRSARPASP
jgi:hypothetical protein